MSSFAASDNMTYSIPVASSTTVLTAQLRLICIICSLVFPLGYGGRPALCLTCAVASIPTARRNDPNRRPGPARQPNHQPHRQPNRRGPGNNAAAEPGPEPEALPAPIVLRAGSSRPSTALNLYHNIQFHRLNKDQIHFLLEDQTRISHYNVDRFQMINNENKYLFVAIGFIKYCLRHPLSNRVIQND
ncbi:hypothetical protein PSTT_15285 [Puccinia striiformis]|uniref:Uncharacterized protein n=1 Tax=Puccinia striiformis TaxID=27350 RepID=A0A2S4UIG4_9BASI|nr:hypothetical protein PSTT_15285 [Puccinia striiformis]